MLERLVRFVTELALVIGTRAPRKRGSFKRGSRSYQLHIISRVIHSKM